MATLYGADFDNLETVTRFLFPENVPLVRPLATPRPEPPLAPRATSRTTCHLSHPVLPLAPHATSHPMHRRTHGARREHLPAQ